MPSLTATPTRRGGFAGGGLSHERALSCPVDGVRCDQVACIDVGSTTENGNVDAERAA
jgi:hypothetical protein